MKKQKILILLLLINFCTSISVAFADNGNKTSTPNSKQLKANVSDSKAEYINRDWWDKFSDPLLRGYIVKAAEANHDLKITSLKVLQSQELIREFFGKEFPLFQLGSNFLREKTSNNISMGVVRFPAFTRHLYNFPLTASYELDLWRKNRQRTIQKAKDFEAAKYDEKTTYISLTTSVATAYFNLVNLDRQLELQKDIINLRENILKLKKENYNHGLSSATDVIMANKSLTEAESGLSDLEKQQSIVSNQLAVLTGSSVDDASSLKRTSIKEIEVIKNIPETVNAEIVQNRPDILKAEAQLQKARIDVSLAKKDFLPDITLTGEFGFNSISLSRLFKWDSYMTSFGANLLQSVFTGGQRRARLKAKKYKYQEMLESYQQTILQAFQEVNDSLASLKADTKKNNNNVARIKSEKDNLDLVNNRYQEGAISYLDTLEYTERVLSLEKELNQSKTDCLIDILSLYKASGGKIQ